MLVLAGAIAVGLVGVIWNCVNEITEKDHEEAKERRRERQQERRDREKEERNHQDKLAAEVRARAERLAAEARAEAREREKRQRTEQRFTRWLERVDEVFLVHTKSQQFVARLIAVDEDGVLLQDGDRVEIPMLFKDLHVRSMDEEALDDPTHWIYPPVVTTPAEVIDLDDA